MLIKHILRVIGCTARLYNFGHFPEALCIETLISMQLRLLIINLKNIDDNRNYLSYTDEGINNRPRPRDPIKGLRVGARVLRGNYKTKRERQFRETGPAFHLSDSPSPCDLVSLAQNDDSSRCRGSLCGPVAQTNRAQIVGVSVSPTCSRE